MTTQKDNLPEATQSSTDVTKAEEEVLELMRLLDGMDICPGNYLYEELLSLKSKGLVQWIPERGVYVLTEAGLGD